MWPQLFSASESNSSRAPPPNLSSTLHSPSPTLPASPATVCRSLSLQKKNTKLQDWLASHWQGFMSPAQLSRIRNTGGLVGQFWGVGRGSGCWGGGGGGVRVVGVHRGFEAAARSWAGCWHVALGGYCASGRFDTDKLSSRFVSGLPRLTLVTPCQCRTDHWHQPSQHKRVHVCVACCATVSCCTV
jgi:hypothetical protein